MQSRPMALGIALVGAIAAVALFVVLREENGDPEPAPQATEQQTTTVQQTTTAEPADEDEPDAEPEEPQRPSLPTVAVRNGEPVGGILELDVSRGERVRFIIRSDVDEEIHVHGFDVYADVEAGGRTRIDFPAEFEGIFEVEMHGSGVEIARITVRP